MRAKQFLNEDWQKVNKKDKTDGLSDKAVKAYRRENPGSKLKTAVTKKPSKIKKGSSDDKRRKSFCARMGGMKKHNASAETKRDPDSPINKALRRWNCESIEELEQALAEAAIGVNPKRPARPGSRPERGHEPQKRYVTDRKTGKQYDPDEEFDKLKNSPEFQAQMKRMATKEDSLEEYGDTAKGQKMLTKVQKRAVDRMIKADDKNRLEPDYTKRDLKTVKKNQDTANRAWDRMTDQDLEEWKASRQLCRSSKPDDELGASALASCKSQGLRARDGNKSHKLGKSPKSRIKVGGHHIKGNKYGGPLPDWSE